MRVIISAVEQSLQAILFGNYAKYTAHVLLRRLKDGTLDSFTDETSALRLLQRNGILL
jgi:hypothetical protein